MTQPARPAHSEAPAAQPAQRPPTPTADGIYFTSARAVAAQLGVSRDTVYDLLKRGHFETLRYGRRRLIFTRSVDRVAQQMVAGEAGPYPHNERRPTGAVRAIGTAASQRRVET